MKKFFIFLMTVMGSFQMHAQDQNFWIFLCFGQSNMAGQAPIEAQDLTVSDRYLSMATTDGGDGRQLGTWRKAVPPLCRADAHLGPADWFGRTLIDVVPENVRIGIVSVAVEGCPITFFDKDQCGPLIAKEERDWMNGILNQYGRNPYERLLSMAKLAAKDGVIKGILLHQGETDAYNDQWRKTLRKIYGDLQQELQFDSTAVPLLVGEVVRKEYGGICGHANPTINDIANHYPNTFVVSSEGCMPSSDNLHFSSEGYRLLGRHYALRYLEATHPQLADVCRQHLAAAGLDKGGSITSKLTVKTRRTGMTLHVSASEAVDKVDVVSFSGKTVKTFTPGSKQEFDLSLQGLPKEKLVFVFQSANGKATTDVDLTMAGETRPLVYDVEHTGSSYSQFQLPAADQLPVARQLPDALEGVKDFDDWRERRSKIAAQIQHYGIGEKPTVTKEQVVAHMEEDTLVVQVTVNGQQLTLRSGIRYPKQGKAPYALMIGTSGISLPKDIFDNRPIATMVFHEAQVNDYSQWRKHHERGQHNFDRLYPHLQHNGAYSQWAWGLSRLIDGLQQLGPEVTRIDTRHIGVTGCSYAGKMALYCGAFDERIALTIAQEPGGGGAAAWRVSRTMDNVENLDKTDYHWFMESMRENFRGDSVYRMPYDQHELCAMICPRALLLLGNPDFKWLADPAMLVSAKAASEVWQRFGISDRMGWSIVGGHGHCQLPDSQRPEVETFIDRFLLNQ